MTRLSSQNSGKMGFTSRILRLFVVVRDAFASFTPQFCGEVSPKTLFESWDTSGPDGPPSAPFLSGQQIETLIHNTEYTFVVTRMFGIVWLRWIKCSSRL